jgi:hypothetical protein
MVGLGGNQVTAHLPPLAHSDAVILLWTITADLEHLIILAHDAPGDTVSKLVGAYDQLVAITGADAAPGPYALADDPNIPPSFWMVPTKEEVLKR